MTNQRSDDLPENHEQMDLSGRLAPSERAFPNFRANDQNDPRPSSSLARKGGAYIYAPRTSERSEVVADRRSESEPTAIQNPDDLLAELVELRERMLAGMDYLYQHLEDDERFARGRHRLIHILVEEYLPRIEQLHAVCDAGDLAARRDDAERRLAIGWGVEKPGADERFAELAVRYAVLSDALTYSVVAPWLDRIVELEAGAA